MCCSFGKAECLANISQFEDTADHKTCCVLRTDLRTDFRSKQEEGAPPCEIVTSILTGIAVLEMLNCAVPMWHKQSSLEKIATMCRRPPYSNYEVFLGRFSLTPLNHHRSPENIGAVILKVPMNKQAQRLCDFLRLDKRILRLVSMSA